MFKQKNLVSEKAVHDRNTVSTSELIFHTFAGCTLCWKHFNLIISFRISLHFHFIVLDNLIWKWPPLIDWLWLDWGRAHLLSPGRRFITFRGILVGPSNVVLSSCCIHKLNATNAQINFNYFLATPAFPECNQIRFSQGRRISHCLKAKLVWLHLIVQ